MSKKVVVFCCLNIIALLFLPVFAFFARYLRVNSFESLFTMTTLESIGTMFAASVLSLPFVFFGGLGLAGNFLFQFDDFDHKPRVWGLLISLTLLIGMFITVLYSVPLNSDPRDAAIEERSQYFFLDDAGGLHYDANCPNQYTPNGSEMTVISFDSALYEYHYSYGACKRCNWVYQDLDTNTIHLYPDCPSLTMDDRKDLSEVILPDALESRHSLCPHCF